MEPFQLLRLILLLGAAITDVTLALFVYKNNPKSATNRLYALLSTVISVWLVANFLSLHPALLASSLYWIRSTIFIAAPMSMLFFLLAHTLPHPRLQLGKKALISTIAATLVVMIINISPYAFTEIEIVSNSPQPVPGVGLLPFSILSTLFSVLAVYVLARKLRNATAVQKIQLRFILLGIVLMLGLVITTVLILVVFFRVNFFVSFIPLYTLVFLGMTARAITRYRFLDIRFILVRSVLFSVLAGTFFLLYGLFVWVLTQLAVARGVQFTPGLHALAAVGVSAVAILGFQWYRAFLQRVTDRVFFKGRYDYRQTLLALGQSLSETIDLDRILSLLTQTLRDTVKVDKVLVFTRDASGKELIVRSTTLPEGKKLRMTSEAPILRHLRHRPGLLVRDELNWFLEQEDPRHNIDEIREIKTAFTWLDCALVMPLIVKGEISGLVLLGDKLSGDPFSSEDLGLLATLAPQAATAIENARLYREAQEFGRKLEVEVARATAELRVANEQLKDTDKAKSEFLSVASHQLYTPLTAIRGYLSMIHEGDFGKVPEKLTETFSIIRESSERLINLIRELLDISRIESGRLELSLESVDLVAMAEALVTELQPNAQRKQLTLTFQKPPQTLPPVVADSQRLRQVLLNTLDNAIKYTAQGSVDVSVTEENQSLLYQVEDTGRGMTKEAIAKLFAKFTRLESNGQRREEGMGLGLYVARQIVREIHGDIWAESAGEGKGSTFFVRLLVEGSKNALPAGTKLTVGIKAAEAGEKPDEAGKKNNHRRSLGG